MVLIILGTTAGSLLIPCRGSVSIFPTDLAHFLIYGWTYSNEPCNSRCLQALVMVPQLLIANKQVDRRAEFVKEHLSACDASFPASFCRKLSQTLRDTDYKWDHEHARALFNLGLLFMSTALYVVLPEGHGLVSSFTIACQYHICQSEGHTAQVAVKATMEVL